MTDSINFSAEYPYGVNEMFPDNGLITFDYDKRVSANDMLKIGRELMHECEAYYKEEALDGTPIYTWNPDFITMIDASFKNNKKENFSKQHSIIFSAYISYLQSGNTSSTTADVMALDSYLGNRLGIRS